MSRTAYTWTASFPLHPVGGLIDQDGHHLWRRALRQARSSVNIGLKDAHDNSLDHVGLAVVYAAQVSLVHSCCNVVRTISNNKRYLE